MEKYIALWCEVVERAFADLGYVGQDQRHIRNTAIKYFRSTELKFGTFEWVCTLSKNLDPTAIREKVAKRLEKIRQREDRRLQECEATAA